MDKNKTIVGIAGIFVAFGLGGICYALSFALGVNEEINQLLIFGIIAVFGGMWITLVQLLYTFPKTRVVRVPEPDIMLRSEVRVLKRTVNDLKERMNKPANKEGE